MKFATLLTLTFGGRLALTALTGFLVGQRASPVQLITLTLLPMVVDTVCAYTIYVARRDVGNGDQ